MENKVDIGCPRCNGDLHVFSDLFGQYEQCIHCGYTNDLGKPKIALYPIDAKALLKKVVEDARTQSSDLSKSVVK